ncbi:MAG: RraA family protein [Thaumarchaeota archaeon]|nr:RraA family protein [Nitrososphaerota archaeon]
MNFAADLGRFSTSSISDALDRLSIKGGLQGILPISDGLKMCGTAFTVRYIPTDQTIKKKWVTYIDQAKRGDVIVVDNGGRLYCTTWGDLLTMKAIEMGLSGTVLYGCCRDVDVIRKMKYPVFSVGRFMMTGKDRVEVETINEPVTVVDVRVSPGDIIVGDDSGVVCVPSSKAKEVLESVKEITSKEEAIADAVKKGVSLTRARKDQGYGELQRAKS